MDTGVDWVEIWMSVKKKKTIMSKPLRHDISKLLEKEGWFVEEKKKFLI